MGTAYGNNLFVAVDSAVGGIYTSQDGSNWKEQAVVGSLHAMAFGNGVFLAAGDAGSVCVSQGTGFWTRLPCPTPNNIKGVTYSNGVFVAVGDSGTILSSAEISIDLVAQGLNWAIAAYAVSVTDTNDSLSSLTYGNGQFVAAGADAGNLPNLTSHSNLTTY